MQKTDFRDTAGKFINIAEVTADSTPDFNIRDRVFVSVSELNLARYFRRIGHCGKRHFGDHGVGRRK